MEGPKPTMQLQFDKPLQIVTPNTQSNTQSIVSIYWLERVIRIFRLMRNNATGQEC